MSAINDEFLRTPARLPNGPEHVVKFVSHSRITINLPVFLGLFSPSVCVLTEAVSPTAFWINGAGLVAVLGCSGGAFIKPASIPLKDIHTHTHIL